MGAVIDPDTGIMPIDTQPLEDEISGKNDTKYLLGSVCGVCAAFCFSLLGVATRKLQKIHPTSMLFSYSIVGALATLVILIIESLATWSPWRFTTYTGAQYGWMILASFISTLSLVCNIIAAQNEKA